MNASGLLVVKYIGALYNAVPGGFTPLLESMYAGYGGNLAAIMRDLSATPGFQSTLVSGTTREIASDLVNRLVGDAAAPTDKAWAVDWFTGNHDAGLSWGEVMYSAISALDSITSGPWGAAADQLRARAAYAATASEHWAANVTDFDLIRDVYSFAVTPFANQPISPIARLLAGDAAIATAAATLGNQSGNQSLTISSAQTGQAVVMGAGDDTVTVNYADLLKPVFVSGGGGIDTLVIKDPGDLQGYVDFINANHSVGAMLPYRGFEKVVFQNVMPGVAGSIDGVKEFTYSVVNSSQGPVGFDTWFGSVDNATTFNLDMSVGGSFGQMRFFEFPPYTDTNLFGTVGALASAEQVVDSLTFNIAGSGSVFLPDLPVSNLTLNVTGQNMSVFLWGLGGSGNAVLPSLESLTVSGNANLNLGKITGPLHDIDLSQLTGRFELNLVSTGASLNDGFVDSISVAAPSGGLFALHWASAVSKTDTYFDFTGQFKAGSNISINYSGARAADMPITKAVFSADFSEINFYNSQGAGPLGNQNAQGSVFDVVGAHHAAAYFKGIAPAGSTIGDVVINGFDQVNTIKVDSASGVNVICGSSNDVTVFINTGAGSVLDNIKASVGLQLGVPVHEIAIAGGKLMWADSNGNGVLDAISHAANSFTPWATGTDFVMMETTSANIGLFNQSIQAMGLGFEPVFDPFI